MGILIIIGVIAIIIVAVMTMSNTVDSIEELKKDEFNIDPKIGDFGIDPSDIPDAQPTPVTPKPKKKYKRKPKNKKMIE